MEHMALSVRNSLESFYVLSDAGVAEQRRLVSEEEVQLAEFRSQDASLYERLVVRKGLIAPIRKIPSEVMSQIFEFCVKYPLPLLERESLLVCDAPPNPSKAPLLLGRVSRLWRQIALSTPQLWSEASIVFTSAAEVSERRLDFLEAWFSRSGHVPFRLRAATKGPEAYVPERLAQLLVANQTRLQEVQISDSKSLYRILADLPATFPLLKVLDIFVSSSHPGFLTPKSTLSLRSAPLLKRLYIETDLPELHPISLTPLWGSLTYLNLSGTSLSVNDSIHIISQCLNLEGCELAIQRTTSVTGADIPDYTFLDDAPVIELPSLSKFVLCAELDMGAFFGRFAFTSLEWLIINSCRWEDASASPIARFLSRSATHLTEFSLVDAQMTDTIFLECLRHMPALSWLTVASTCEEPGMITEMVLASLTVNRRDTPLVPRLRSFDADLYDHLYGAGTLADMIISRWHLFPTTCLPEIAVSRLESAHIFTDFGPTDNIYDLLNNCVEEGLDLTVEDRYEGS